MYYTRAADILDNGIIALPEDTRIDEVGTLVGASGRRCRYVAMITSGGQLSGIVEYPLKSDGLAPSSLQSYASPPPPNIGPNKSAMETVRFMLGNGHDLLAVADDGGFVGIVTRASVMDAFGEVIAS